MIVLFDSWAWIDCVFNGPFSENIKKIYQESSNTIVTTKINLYEVYSKILKIKGKDAADQAINQIMHNSKILPINLDIIKSASELKIKKGFGMADSIILSSAIRYRAKILTGDPDFKNVKEVEVEFLG